MLGTSVKLRLLLAGSTRLVAPTPSMRNRFW
ncbi:Uncharacterised protein [Bordetella pertussis]|nr:Uncharacterised protein [Bordetella pertussis]CFP61038.1 Uncharacterised protein [Bordetella pertussis]CFW31816.1 Uncharacterised protein [Bordetella pertussis]